MDQDEVTRRLEEIDFSRSPRKAEELEAQAQSMPVGEPGRVTFLVAAGGHRQMDKQYDEARRLFELAVEDGGGGSMTHPKSHLLSLALELGDEDAVAPLLVELRGLVRDDRLGTPGCHFVGDTLRRHGRLREAMRWFTIPLTYTDLEDGDLDYLCLIGRYQVRRELEMPQDRFDQIAESELVDPSG